MDPHQTTAPPTYTTSSASPGLFGTRIPASAAFVVGILLFFLPFAEIKCSGTTLMTQSGLNFAMNKEWKLAKGEGLLKGSSTEKEMSPGKEEKGNSQYFAIAALALGVLGLLVSFGNAKTGGGAGLVMGLLAAGSLIALMVDLKKHFNDSMKSQAMDKAAEGSDNMGLDQLGNAMNNMKPTLHFTPWFYIAVVAFLLGAVFCYQRMRTSK